MEKPQNQETGVKMLSQLRGMIECRCSCENRLGSNTDPSLHLRAVVVVFLLLALGLHIQLVTAQGLDSAALLKPATETWPTYNGDYSASLQHARPDQCWKRRLAYARLDLSAACVHDQIDPSGSERHSLLHGARQRLGRRCSLWAGNLALPARFRRRPHWQSRVGHVQELALLYYARCTLGLSRREGRQRSLDRRARRSKTRLLLDHGAACHTRSPDRGRLGGRYGCSGFPRVTGSGNRSRPMALVHRPRPRATGF